MRTKTGTALIDLQKWEWTRRDYLGSWVQRTIRESWYILIATDRWYDRICSLFIHSIASGLSRE